MKKVRFRPAFVVTLTALTPMACQKRTETSNPPPPPPPTVTSQNEVPPAQGTKKRTVRAPLPAFGGSAEKFDWGKAQRLNPKHGGNTIMAAQDGTCFVEVQADPSAPIGPPGSGLVAKPVDCPDEMQDPAWDTCLGGLLLRTAEGACVCERTGNPPPPAERAECPKSGGTLAE